MAGQYAVLGLGQFGQSVARHLVRHGQSVLAVDRDMERVETIQDEVDAALCADVTDEDALESMELDRMTCVIVAIGNASTESSIMTTALLSEMGIPRIIGRGVDKLHDRILRSVGAHEVIDPENEMGGRLARRLSQPNIVDQFELGDAVLAEIQAPDILVGETLAELDLRNTYHVSVIAIQRNDNVRPNPPANARIESGDVLVVLGGPDDVEHLASQA